MSSASDIPQAYVDGYIEFCGLSFDVTPDVLIPRFETEMLVNKVINFAKTFDAKDTLNILEVGTGSGCISISLAKKLSQVKITATDVSDRALKIAQKNSIKHNTNNRITFIQSDLLEKVDKQPDIIVANLPYIPSHRIDLLDKSVKDFEPHLALDGGMDGFDIYRKLFKQIIEKKLMPEMMVFEIDDNQGDLALKEANKFFEGIYINLTVIKDVSTFDRVLKLWGLK